MNIVTWLRDLFRPRVTRDVSRLEDGSDGAGAAEEVVDVSGGPLKEGHRRRALRDRRLLPKHRPAFPLLGRQRLMTDDEARRLFGGTLRTRNRRLRALLPDEEQLARHGLPAWKTEEDVAAALGLSLRQLRHFSIHRDDERVVHYTTFTIPKRSGGERVIMAPKRRLKRLQR